MPKASVIIPSYNHEAYISQAIYSVLCQSEPDLELIVIDDGSTDHSLDAIRKIHDPRLILISQSNQGAHAAINRGLNEAKGEFLAVLNSDDLYHPDRLKCLVAQLESNPELGLASSYLTIIDAVGVTLGIKHGYRDQFPWPLEDETRSFRNQDDPNLVMLTENFLATTSNYVFTRRCYEKVGEFLPLRYTHDWDFAIRLMRFADIYIEPEPLLSYRVHSKNTIRENQAAMIFEICWILAVHLPGQTEIMPGSPRNRILPVSGLLNSIYVFGFEKVLIGLLVEQIVSYPERALSLLEPGNPDRVKYLEYINQGLAGRSSVEIAASAAPPDIAHRVFSRIPRPLQQMLRRARRFARG